LEHRRAWDVLPESVTGFYHRATIAFLQIDGKRVGLTHEANGICAFGAHIRKVGSVRREATAVWFPPGFPIVWSPAFPPETTAVPLDRIDVAIIAELMSDGRASHTELSHRVGLSSTALARRQKTLEESGYIKGYQAILDLAQFDLGTTVLVRIALESQSDEALTTFEAEVVKCPSVVRCFLMSGSDDYILIVMARDIEDFERIHRTELSRLPRVARVQSSFALREVVNRVVPNVIFRELRR
jgi:DNA-binding Lrp family transcriptional regulator